MSLQNASRLSRATLAALTATGLFVICGQSTAHHAFAAEFDADQPIDLKGAVTKIKWVNPHSWLFFDVKDASGNVTNWGVEFGAPNQLARIGLKKTDVAIGTEESWHDLPRVALAYSRREITGKAVLHVTD